MVNHGQVESTDNKTQKQTASQQALLILGSLVTLSLLTVIILLEFFPSEISTYVEKWGIGAVVSGGAGLFIVIFIFYNRSYIKLFNLLLGINCFLFAGFHYFEIKAQIEVKNKETIALRQRIRRMENNDNRLQQIAFQNEVAIRERKKIIKLIEDSTSLFDTTDPKNKELLELYKIDMLKKILSIGQFEVEKKKLMIQDIPVP